MSYTRTYIFGTDPNNGIKLGDGERAKLTLVFTIRAEGEDEIIFAPSKNIRVVRFGRVRMNYELDEYLMMPAEYELLLDDRDGELQDMLFNYGTLNDATEKDFFVKLEMLYKNKVTYETRFSGYAIPKLTAQDDVFRNEIRITAMPKSNILNQKYLYEDGWNAADFDSSTDRQSSWPLNPLGLGFYKSGKAIKWLWYYLYNAADQENSLLHLIMKLINPSMQLSLHNSLKYWGCVGFPSSPEYQNQNLAFSDLILDGNWIGSVFGSSILADQFQTVADVLRAIAFESVSVVGIETQDRAFFKELFYFDEANVQTLGKVCDNKENKRAYRYENIDFTEIKSRYITQDTGNANRYLVSDPSPRGYRSGYELVDDVLVWDKRGGKQGLSRNIISCMDTIPTLITAPYTRSNVKALRTTGSYYDVYALKNPRLDIMPIGAFGYPGPSGYYPLSVYLAEHHFLMRSSLYKSAVQTVTVEGRDYTFTKGFVKDGLNHSVVGIDTDIDNGVTTIESIIVDDREVETDGTGGNGYAPFLSVLPTGYYKDFTYVKEITGEEANEATGIVPVFKIMGQQRIAEIKFIFPKIPSTNTTGWEGITGMEFKDEDGLIIGDSIKWKPEDFEIIEEEGLRTVKFYEKTYGEEQILYMEFVGTADTAARMNVEIRYLSKEA